MSVEMYRQILDRLLDYRFLTKYSDFHIYGLGEPLLHPQLEIILESTIAHGLKTDISTNASTVPSKMSALATEGVKRILISMPGFSQASQDKIHGFLFEKIKNNILRLKDMFWNVPFDMSYHIYQFNLNEIEDARQFCIKNNIRFSPNYAVLFDRNKCLDYVNNRLSYEELKELTSDLLIQTLEHQIQSAPKDYCDFMHRYLSINVDGNVRVCNSFTKSYEGNILCGNILHSHPDEILQKKCSQSFCLQCINAGLTFAEGYDCKMFPDFYYSLLKENEYLQNHFVDTSGLTSDKINFMHQVRRWEEEHFSNEALDAIFCFIKEKNLTSEDVEDIVCNYARFKEKTYARLQSYIKSEKIV